MVGGHRESGRRHGEKRPRVLSTASANPVSAPEKGYDEEYDYEDVSAMQDDKG